MGLCSLSREKVGQSLLAEACQGYWQELQREDRPLLLAPEGQLGVIAKTGSMQAVHRESQ